MPRVPFPPPIPPIPKRGVFAANVAFLTKILDSHEFKVRFIQVHRKLTKVRTALHAVFSNDPWALLTVLGARHTTPIHHERNVSQPITVNLGCDTTTGEDGKLVHTPKATTAYVVEGDTKPAPKRKVIPEGEPLGPEDYEVGLRVSPAEVEEKLQELWQRPPTLPD